MPTSEFDQDEEADALAERIKERRLFLGFSQAQVAETLKVSRAAVSAIETGRRRITGVELGRLADLYGTTGDQLLGKAVLEDATTSALFRTTRDLSDDGKLQLLQFAEFLRNAGTAPKNQNN
ncbi:MAG: family transcriptional regulator [Microbacteriaceae bacterium]|nr:family transcriptional regulator [Microbacteriaceae bacterium]